MADTDEGQTTTPRGADWEVVSLTASAYAAAPGGNMPEFKHEEMAEKDKVESSNALFMSGHFVLPSSKHDMPSEYEKTEILDQLVGKDYGSESVKNVSGKPDSKEEENWNLMNLANADFTKDSTLSGLNISEKEQSIYGSPMLHSLHNEATIGALNIDDETNVLDESIQSSDPILDSSTASFPTKEDNHEGSGTPYSAWLKKQAISLYAHAKETNAFWSVFAVAAVMGIVIIGRRWQQERWQGLRHELKSKVNDEKMRMMAGPVSRFKDAIVGGHRQDFAARGSIFQEL
uniref:ATG8-interacting protein 2-like n=1 Tax=Erigeron canadensis TaxID=72917 RepID=UPI001CB994F8|nr:ATG8-interacting protein 2-like [Erigeron canadensis]